MTKANLPWEIFIAPKSKVWFYKPEWYWPGWRSLMPIRLSHDEYSRQTLVIGWHVTGQIIIALRYCGDKECYADTRDYLLRLKDNPDD